MKKLYRFIKILCLIVLASPLALAWLPQSFLCGFGLIKTAEASYNTALVASFKELSFTLVATMSFAVPITVILAYTSVLYMRFGRGCARVLGMVESVPSILIALFFYAPVSGYLARNTSDISEVLSLFVFILAATLITLPEAVRGIAIPLNDLYNRKYSLSFRSYGFTKRRILLVLMNTNLMRNNIKRMTAGILLKTLVLDCSFGFIIQLGFGSYGTPAHISPGALIAANRDALFEGGNPVLFWVPSILLAAISIAFLLTFNDRKEADA